MSTCVSVVGQSIPVPRRLAVSGDSVNGFDDLEDVVMPPLKLLRCDCCKEDKPTGCFSASGAVRDYSAFCKSCQSWIKLIREAGRKEQFRPYTKRYKPQVALQQVWKLDAARAALEDK